MLPPVRHVVILSDYANVFGGAEKVALVSAKALASRGVRVVVVSAIGPIDPTLSEVEGIEVVCLDQDSFYTTSGKVGAISRLFWNRDAAAALAKVLEGLDPATTVVHAHSYLKMLSSSTLDAALKRGFRTALTLHDYGIACPQQSFFDHPRSEICHRTPLGLSCWTCQCTPRSYPMKAGLLVRAVVQQRIAKLPQRMTAYLAVSSFSHNVLKPFLPAQTPVIPVRNPVDLTHEPRARVEENQAFAFVGRLTVEKAPELLALAAARLQAPALFVGEGTQREAILRANPAAEITGWIDATEVWGHTRRARALCVTSKWYEAAPLVVFDALALGIPIVVSDACAAQEFVEHGVTGLHFRNGDAEHLTECLRELADDDTVRAMSETAYERFWSNPPTLDAHLDELMGAYAAILALPPPT